MNAQAQEFIDKMKEIEKRKKNEKLISLGLIDESKTMTKRVTKDVDYYTPNSKYDSENKQYYVETTEYFAIDVTDEEYQEILKYSSFAKNKRIKKEVTNTTWASSIKIIAIIMMFLNFIGAIILCHDLADSSFTEGLAWIPIASALTYCIFWYPLIVGFSKLVAVAEKKLEE